MKKLLLSLLSIISLSAFAQKDLSITLLEPLDSAEINSLRPFDVALSVKNAGTDTILATDSFIVILGIGGNVITAAMYGAEIIPGDSILQGGALTITLPSDLGWAPFFAAVSFKDTVANVDPNLGNNIDFSIVNLRVFPTGLAQLQALANSVTAYPNPANTEFTLTMDASNATVEIMDITGRSIESAAVTMGEARLNVSSYNNGVYFYNVRNEAGSMVKSGKFTVSH